MVSRIEQNIAAIEEYIDECKFAPLSNTKIMVNKDELDDLLAELKSKTPEEIRKYQKIISNKEAIIADAQKKAEKIINDAQIQTNELVSEHQIMQQAYAQANQVVQIATNQAQEIVDSATKDANDIRTSAIAYTDDMLHNLENIVASNMQTSKTKYDSYLKSLDDCYQIIRANRNELIPTPELEEDLDGAADGNQEEIINLD